MNSPLTTQRTKRAVNILGLVLLIALVVPFAVYAVPEVVGADESFVVLTPSMTPAIAPGDVVVVAERDPAAIEVGDVITFARGTSDVPVTHRVIDVVEEGGTIVFETQGDANEGPDPGLVPAANLVGAVTLTIPVIGYVIQFAGTQAGFITLVLLPFGLLALTEIYAVVTSRKETPVQATDASETPPATGDTGTATEGATGGSGVSVDTVGGAAGVLTAFAPYAVYVAFELRTAVAIAVAIGTTTLLLGALAAWLPASGVLDRDGHTLTLGDGQPNPTDGGTQSFADSDLKGRFQAAEPADPTAQSTDPDHKPTDPAAEFAGPTGSAAAEDSIRAKAASSSVATEATEEGN